MALIGKVNVWRQTKYLRRWIAEFELIPLKGQPTESWVVVEAYEIGRALSAAEDAILKKIVGLYGPQAVEFNLWSICQVDDGEEERT